MALTTLEVRNAPPGRYVNGKGLYLLVRSASSRSWVLRTQVHGRRQDLGLGSARAVTLAQARAAAGEMRRRLKAGKEARFPAADEVESAPTVPTFRKAAAACHEAIEKGWRNRRHQDSWISSFHKHIHPRLGSVLVDEVNATMVRDAIAPIWMTIPETARRILQRIGTVLDFAHISGW